MDIKKIVPESRKLRVLIASVIGIVLHSLFPFLDPLHYFSILGIIGAWMGFQGIADAGMQGKVNGEIRAAIKAGLDVHKIVKAVREKDMETLAEQAAIATKATVGIMDAVDEAEAAEKAAKTAAEASKPEAPADSSHSEEDDLGK